MAAYGEGGYGLGVYGVGEDGEPVDPPIEVTGTLVGTGSWSASAEAIEPGVIPDATGTLVGAGTWSATAEIPEPAPIPEVDGTFVGAGLWSATAYDASLQKIIEGQPAGAFVVVGEGSFGTSYAFYLLVLDPFIEQAPGVVTVSMSNLPALAEVTFEIDGVVVETEYADANGDIVELTLPVDRQFGAGSHVITGTASGRHSEGTFTVGADADALPDVPVPSIPPDFQDAGQSWVLQDLTPGGLGSWVMPISPSSMGAPHVHKTVAVSSTTAVRGRAHVSEGATPVEWQFAGFCPNKAFYDKLLAYRNLPYRFYLLDHRSRGWTVAFTNVEMKTRKRFLEDSGQPQDWAGDYTVNAVLFSQALVTA